MTLARIAGLSPPNKDASKSQDDWSTFIAERDACSVVWIIAVARKKASSKGASNDKTLVALKKPAATVQRYLQLLFFLSTQRD